MIHAFSFCVSFTTIRCRLIPTLSVSQNRTVVKENVISRALYLDFFEPSWYHCGIFECVQRVNDKKIQRAYVQHSFRSLTSVQLRIHSMWRCELLIVRSRRTNKYVQQEESWTTCYAIAVLRSPIPRTVRRPARHVDYSAHGKPIGVAPPPGGGGGIHINS